MAYVPASLRTYQLQAACRPPVANAGFDSPAAGAGQPRHRAGLMSGITYIERINTQGGVAPFDACTATNAGARKMVKYQADQVFYKAS